MMLAIIEHAGLFGFPIRFVDEPPLGFVEPQVRLRAHDVRPRAAMSETWMNRVHAIFNALKPVTVLEPLDGDVDIAFAHEKIISRQEGHRLGTKIGEDQSAQLLYGIGGQTNRFLFELAVWRLSGCLQKSTVGVIEPTVISTSHPISLDVAKTEVRAAMGAVSANDPSLARAVAEEHQIFAEHADKRRLGLEVRRDADGPPVTAEKLAHRRAATSASQNFIFFFCSSVHGSHLCYYT